MELQSERIQIKMRSMRVWVVVLTMVLLENEYGSENMRTEE